MEDYMKERKEISDKEFVDIEVKVKDTPKPKPKVKKDKPKPKERKKKEIYVDDAQYILDRLTNLINVITSDISKGSAQRSDTSIKDIIREFKKRIL